MKGLGLRLVWFVQTLLRRWFFLFTLGALYYYHVRLDKDMRCSCKSQTLDCWTYLFVPGLVLFLVQLWLDLSIRRVLNLLCGSLCGKMVLVLFKRVLEAVFVGLLWVESVLLDGDWYVCCGRGNIRCSKYDYYEERPDSDEIRNESQVIGMLLVFVVTLLAAILSWLPWRRWFSAAACDWPEAVLEEAELVVSQRIRTAAQDQLRTRLDQHGTNGDWTKYQDLDRDLLQNKTGFIDTVQMSSLPTPDQF